MRVTTDDALRRVDARWLGVPGWTFPWRPIRYGAYGVGIPIALLLILAGTRLFGAGFWKLVSWTAGPSSRMWRCCPSGGCSRWTFRRRTVPG